MAAFVTNGAQVYPVTDEVQLNAFRAAGWKEFVPAVRETTEAAPVRTETPAEPEKPAEPAAAKKTAKRGRPKISEG